MDYPDDVQAFLERNRIEVEQVKADIEERRQRREAGLEPQLWQAPEPQQLVTRDTTGADAVAARKASGPSNRAIWDSITALAKEIGGAVGQIEKRITRQGEELRNEIAGAKAEWTSDIKRQIGRLLEAKSSTEEFRADTSRQLLKYEAEIAQLRREIEALRTGSIPLPSVLANGTGKH